MDPVHLMVVRGDDTGKAITVPAAGARLGRSSKNDIVLADPSLSRHHCRFYFKPEGTLCVADLGSSNQTLVNNAPITEVELHVGDIVVVGNDELKVVDTRRADVAAAATVAPNAPPNIDLGFKKEAPETDAKRRSRIYFLVGLLGVTIVAAGVALQWARGRNTQQRQPQKRTAVATREDMLEFDYEKVQADTNNIFRYRLTLSGGRLSAEIDDLQNNRHVQPREFTMDKANMQSLVKFVEESAFFDLDPEYRGTQPDSLDSFDMRITVGRKTHRVRVVNRLEPDGFRLVREKMEDTGKNLLGTWAIGFSPEKLLQLANDAYLTGRKLYDEREVRYENLWNAIRSFREAEWYLETVDKKPDFYPDVVHQSSVCVKELDRRYEDTNFRAQKAIRLRDWNQAAKELRIICEMIPSREDKRHAQARRDLLDAENQTRIER
jgi:hypothetical protein